MSTTWWVIVGLTVTTFVIKAAGPVVLGGREPSPTFLRVISMMAPALLAALVVTSVFAEGRDLAVGAETAGVAVGGVLLVRGRSLVLAVGAAVVVTGALRAVL
jgi:branched-subunit amino acid transport protein